MTIGTSDGQQYEDQFQHALAVGEPPYHPPEWIGNRNYGPIFNWLEKYPNMQSGDMQQGIKTRLDPLEEDMDKSPLLPAKPQIPFEGEPRSFPPQYGMHNKVSSTAPTMPSGATEKPAGEFKSNLGTKVAMNDNFKASDALQVFQPSAIGEGKQHLPSMPAAPKVSERVVMPAVQAKDGRYFTGINHGEAYEAATSAGLKTKDLNLQNEGQGFMTNYGRYVDRKEALSIANKAKQIPDTESIRPSVGLMAHQFEHPSVVAAKAQRKREEETLDWSKWTDPDIPFKLKK